MKDIYNYKAKNSNGKDTIKKINDAEVMIMHTIIKFTF